MRLRVLVMVMLAVAEPTLAATPRLERIDVVGDRAPAVRLHLSAAVSATAHRLPAQGGAPARIYIDLRGAALDGGLLHVTPGAGPVLRVRAAQFGPTTARVVIELERSVPFSLRQEGETITLEPQAPAPTVAATEPPAPPAPPAPPLPAEGPSAPTAPEAANPPADAAPYLDSTPRSVSFSLRQADSTIMLEPQAPAPTVAATEPPAPSAPPASPLPTEGPSAPETTNPPADAPHLDAALPSVPLALRQGDPTIMLEPQAPAPTVAATEAPAPSAPPPSEAPSAPPATNPPADAAPHLEAASPSARLALRQGDATIMLEPQAPAPRVATTEAPAPSAPPAPPLPSEGPSAPEAPPLPSDAPSALATPEATNPPADGTSQPPTSPRRPQSPGSQVKPRKATRPLVVHPPLIVLDAGHGGRDPGAAGIGGVLEKDIVLEVTQMVASRLATRLPVDVLLTRTGDSFVPIERRIAMPGDGATLFISLHANACSDPSAQGLEVFYGGGGVRTASTPGGSWRAALLGRCLDHALQSRVGGVRGEARPGSFGILVRNPAPSALIEIGYLTHPGEAARTQDRRYHELLADAVVEGVAAFLHASAPPL